MTLSGNLGFVPIDEILRLLTRSSQKGAVEVTGDGFRGRVFVGVGGVDFATTSDDDVLLRHLENSGFADVNVLQRISFGDTTLAAEVEGDEALIDLLREMTVESLHQISDRSGDFQVLEGQTTPYASPKAFDLENLLRDAQDRGKKWEKVREAVPDLHGAIRLQRELGDREEVTIKKDDWKVLSEVGDGKSVHQIADHLGTTEFWVASVVARLASNDLVDIELPEIADELSEPTPVANTYEEATPTDDESAYEDPAFDGGHDYQDTTEEESDTDEVDESTDAEIAVSDESAEDEPWWQEPETEYEEEAEEDDEPRTPEVVSEGLSEIPAIGGINRDSDDNDEDEDTEAFLEKVFSELDSDKSETDEGHGLLRRRRMGTLRDFSSDS